MASRITLLLVAPAILVPVALLVGFAACDLIYKLNRDDAPAVIESATGKDVTTITVDWMKSGGSSRHMLDRTDPDGVTTSIELFGTPFDDTGLKPGKTYSYVVRGLDGSGGTKTTSDRVDGMTLPVTSIYAKALTEPSAGWERYTVVQRIEAASFTSGVAGSHVRITLQAATSATVDRVYISQADPTKKPYDSAGDLTPVYDIATQLQPFTVLASDPDPPPLPIVAYTVNQFQALIIAIDFNVDVQSAIASASNVPASEASAYYLVPPQPEAAVAVRSPNYSGGVDAMGNSFVLFVANVEIG